MNGSGPICATDTSGWDVTHGYRNVSLNDYLGSSGIGGPQTPPDRENPDSPTTPRSPDPKYVCGITDEDGNEQVVRWWLPQVDKERIYIPTVHIHGAQDGWLQEAYGLLAMCDKKTAVVWQHSGGHGIPRNKEIVKKIAELIEKAAVKSQTMMY